MLWEASLTPMPRSTSIRRDHFTPQRGRSPLPQSCQTKPVARQQHDTRRPNSNPPNDFGLLSPKTHQATPGDTRQRLASSSVCGRRLRRRCRSPRHAAAAPSRRFGVRDPSHSFRDNQAEEPPVASRQHDRRHPNSNPPNNFGPLSPKTHQATPRDTRQRLASSSVCGRRLRRRCRSPRHAAADPSSRFGVRDPSHRFPDKRTEDALSPCRVPQSAAGVTRTLCPASLYAFCRQKRVRRQRAPRESSQEKRQPPLSPRCYSGRRAASQAVSSHRSRTTYDVAPVAQSHLAQSHSPSRLRQSPPRGARLRRARHQPVFGPADPGGPYKHPAAIEELANGDLYIVFYGGQGEYEGDTAVYGSRLAKGRRSGPRRSRSPTRLAVPTATASSGKSRAAPCGSSTSCATATPGPTR